MWCLSVSSSLAFSMSRTSFSDDFYIFSTFNYSEEESFYFGSPHLNEIPKEDSELAYYRAKALINLVNGCLLLDANLILGFENEILWIENDIIRGGFRMNYQSDIREYEELVNPFVTDLSVREHSRPSYMRECLLLVKEEPIVRQSILCLLLSKQDALYFLTNVYKIYENIFMDLGIPKNAGSYKANHQNLFPAGSGLREHLDYFLLGNFAQYVNSVEGSGILSRHGHSNTPYRDREPLDLKEIDVKIRNLINCWLQKKIEERFNISYNFRFENRRSEFTLDEDYNF